MKTKKQNDPLTELSVTELRLVRKAIADHGWTIERFAEESAVAESTVWQYFSGSRSPSQEAREKMAKVLDLDVKDEVFKSSRIIKRIRQ